MRNYDVIVIGAGVAGSAAAYALARDQRVLLLEQHRFLHTHGSSHGGSRIFRYAYPQPQYVALARAAEEGWRALEHDVGENVLTTTGGLDIGPAGSEGLAQIEQAVAGAGQKVERLSPTHVAARFPAFALADNEEALFQPSAGILAATRAVNALLRGAAQRGAHLHDEEPVTGFKLTGDRVRVTTEKGSYEAGILVVTAGPWLGSLLKELHLPLKVEQQQVLYVRTERPSDFLPARMPIFINHQPGSSVYGFPLFDDPVSIKISDHEGAPTIDLAKRGTELMSRRAAETLKRARRFLPGLTGELRHFELCLYTKTFDEHFILDRHPQYANVVVGGGFSGHGFKFGPALGEVLRALSLGEGTGFDLGMFGLNRFNRA